MNSPSLMSRRPPGCFRVFSFCFRSVFTLGIILPLFSNFNALTAVEKAVRSSSDTQSKDVPAASETSPSSAPATSDIVTLIDEQIAQGWMDNEISPSPEATDEEFFRRIHLDLCGRIPSTAETRDWMDDRSPRKKSLLTDRLLESNDFVRNWTTIWTNLCIGRGNPRFVSRPSMEKFFREAFARRRPWNEVIVDLISAEGHYEENGAVNYILAQMQMPDDAVQLTAMTSRLFLGTQIQCTQCHNHPFNKWQQDEFWEFNSFFRQLAREEHRRFDAATGRMVDDYAEVVWRDFGDPVFFEKRNGEMRSAYPKFQGVSVAPDATTDRRAELVKLINQSPDGQPTQIAMAFVNRTWGHFFGYGFTRPIDDMGPHNPVSHPAVLEALAKDFVQSGYDVRHLARVICSTRAYSLSSQSTKQNESDNPAAGEVPLFSHMAVKSMPAEVLYDSLIVASNAHQSGRGGWEAQEQQRRAWMQQFVVTFENDENDEATTFNGTIPQALMMMNSELIEKAVSLERGSFLHETLNRKSSESQKIEELFLAALSREPTRAETQKFQKMLASYPSARRAEGYQDLFWALLNSNEFVFIH